MQFTVSKSALCQALALVSRVAAKRSTIPILCNVKLEAADGLLRVTGTDLDVALTTKVEANVKATGALTIPADRLYSYVRLLSEGDVKFTSDDKDHITINAGRSRTRIPGMPVDTFPEHPEAPEPVFTIAASALMSLFNRVKLAISAEASRFTLNGALLERTEDRLQLVATDGHRLSFAWIALPGPNVRFLVPITAIKHLAALLDGVETVTVAHDENHIFFSAGESLLVSRKLSGNFPDYERVLPKPDAKIQVTVNRTELAGAVSRVAQFADSRSRAIRLTLGDGLEVFSSAVESGEASEGVECGYQGEELQVGFNATYLSEFLSVLDCDSITLHFHDAKSAGELRPAESDNFRYVVMPMRI